MFTTRISLLSMMRDLADQLPQEKNNQIGSEFEAMCEELRYIRCSMDAEWRVKEPVLPTLLIHYSVPSIALGYKFIPALDIVMAVTAWLKFHRFVSRKLRRHDINPSNPYRKSVQSSAAQGCTPYSTSAPICFMRYCDLTILISDLI